MGNSSYLNSLVQSGADAQSNLYKATFTFSSNEKGIGDTDDTDAKAILGSENFEELAVRLTKFDSPSRGIQYASLPYQNINIDIPVISSTMENKMSLSFRVDSNYKLYTLLEKSMPLNRDGEWSSTPNEKVFEKVRWTSIKIEAFSNISQKEESQEISETLGLSWEFIDCQLLNIPSLSYSYDNSNSLVATCDFLYRYCKNTSDGS